MRAGEELDSIPRLRRNAFAAASGIRAASPRAISPLWPSSVSAHAGLGLRRNGAGAGGSAILTFACCSGSHGKAAPPPTTSKAQIVHQATAGEARHRGAGRGRLGPRAEI